MFSTLDKRIPPNFETFEYSCKNVANSSCHFPSHKLVFFSNSGETLYTLHKRNHSKWRFWEFQVLRSKFTKFLSFLTQQISFSSNFASLFSVMRHNLSILFLAEFFYIFNKRSLSKYKFGEISHEHSKVWNVALWWVPFVHII